MLRTGPRVRFTGTPCSPCSYLFSRCDVFSRNEGKESDRGFATSRFNGVYWHGASQAYDARVSLAGKAHLCGRFACEEQAGLAYDTKLRELCKDGHRLKQSLNFPSAEELAFAESPEDRRARNLQMFGDNEAKETKAFSQVMARFKGSATSSEFEIVRVSSSSRIDAMFLKNGSPKGLPIQLKSRSGRGDKGHYYQFKNIHGYAGMLLLLVALDRDIIWAMVGSRVDRDSIGLTLNTSKEFQFRVSCLASLLEYCFYQSSEYLHLTLEDARLQCSVGHVVEEQARRQKQAVLSQVGFWLQPCAHGGVVDSTLCGHGCAYDVQEKATRQRRGRSDYKVNLRRSGGRVGHRAYTSADFDLLIISLLDGECRLEGLYLIPTKTLAQHGLVDERPVTLHLFPPWAPAKHKDAIQRHAWQLDHFVDLRGWAGGQLSGDLEGRLLQLLDPGLHVKSPLTGLYTPFFNSGYPDVASSMAVTMHTCCCSFFCWHLHPSCLLSLLSRCKFLRAHGGACACNPQFVPFDKQLVLYMRFAFVDAGGCSCGEQMMFLFPFISR